MQREHQEEYLIPGNRISRVIHTSLHQHMQPTVALTFLNPCRHLLSSFGPQLNHVVPRVDAVDSGIVALRRSTISGMPHPDS